MSDGISNGSVNDDVWADLEPGEWRPAHARSQMRTEVYISLLLLSVHMLNDFEAALPASCLLIVQITTAVPSEKYSSAPALRQHDRVQEKSREYDLLPAAGTTVNTELQAEVERLRAEVAELHSISAAERLEHSRAMAALELEVRPAYKWMRSLQMSMRPGSVK